MPAFHECRAFNIKQNSIVELKTKEIKSFLEITKFWPKVT